MRYININSSSNINSSLIGRASSIPHDRLNDTDLKAGKYCSFVRIKKAELSSWAGLADKSSKPHTTTQLPMSYYCEILTDSERKTKLPIPYIPYTRLYLV